MAKGNQKINRTIAKVVVDGKIAQDLPVMFFNGQMVPLFTVFHPDRCIICGSSLKINDHYDRYIISSYGIILVPTIYWICSNPDCGKHHTDTIIGVTGSANYSDEFIEKEKCVRNNGRCTLWNTNTVGKIFTHGLTDTSGRAPCPTTIWIYEQKGGQISTQKLLTQEIKFDGTLHIDGYWVKMGWRTFIEEQMGKELTDSEWNRIRYKVIYVVATKEKVVIDFEITDNMIGSAELIPLLNRIKNRIPEEQIKQIVSDEEDAIIGAVKQVFPNAAHSFCVFHQLENVAKKFREEFKHKEDIPLPDLEIYKTANELVAADNAIESTILYRKIIDLAKNTGLSEASRKVIKYIKKIYVNNIKLLTKGFLPETNNVMEQLFSLINDYVNQTRSLKTEDGMKNFFSNLFVYFNNRPFNTGRMRGLSPLERADILNN
jgi:hypothetical protein